MQTNDNFKDPYSNVTGFGFGNTLLVPAAIEIVDGDIADLRRRGGGK
jgi:hypothetical protein